MNAQKNCHQSELFHCKERKEDLKFSLYIEVEDLTLLLGLFFILSFI